MFFVMLTFSEAPDQTFQPVTIDTVIFRYALMINCCHVGRWLGIKPYSLSCHAWKAGIQHF